MRVRVAVAALVCASAFAGVASAPAAAAPLLPDLTQETPYDLGIATDGKRYHLGFGSVVYNYGDGPLRIVGSRESDGDLTMSATQYVDQDDGSQVARPGIGGLRYVDAITHRHWHYLKFDTYSLRRPDGSLARADRKTGFCLGDRRAAPSATPIPGMQPYAEYGGNCGYDSPELTRVEEGIAVGYGDDYGPQLEGQFVDITRLPAGRYVLVHRVNADGALQEKTLDNNAASVLIDLRYKGKVPRVTQVARCPNSGTCPVVPALTDRRAVRLARDAFRRAFTTPAVNVTCGTPGTGRVACSGLIRGSVRTMSLRYSVAHGRLYLTYSASLADPGRRARARIPVDLGPKRRVPVARENGFAARGAAAKRVGYCPLIGRG